MNIKPAVYENLTPHTRVLATLEADARGDTAEIKRLVQSCPKKNYTMNDAVYVDTLRVIEDIVLYVESTLSGYSLCFMFFGKDKDKEPLDSLRHMLAVHTAWHETLTAHDIDPAMVERVFSRLNHPITRYFLEKAQNVIALDAQDRADYEAEMGKPCPFPRSTLAPNPADVEEWKKLFDTMLNKAAQV